MKRTLVVSIAAGTSLLLFSMVILVSVASAQRATARKVTAPRLTPHRINLKSGEKFDLMAPADYEISVAAEGYDRLRFMALSPDRRLFVTDMHSLADNEKGKIYIFDRFNASKKRFESVATYLDKLRNPNSIAFYTDRAGVHWLYVALTDRLIRYRYTPGDVAPGSKPEVLTTFPAYGLDYKYGGWHLTRTVAIQNHQVYVAVGSSCNACEEKESVRASIIRMNPDGSGLVTYATGLRNAVGLKPVGNDLWATNMGADHLGDGKPNDQMYRITQNTDYGWPYCYVSRGKTLPDRTIKWERKNYDCGKVPAPHTLFRAHSAPLGLEHFGTSFAGDDLRGSFLVALHGSGKVRLGAGYSIVRVGADRSVHDFITGFLRRGKRYGRPVDILRRDDRSFFFTDDFRGVLYLVSRK